MPACLKHFAEAISVRCGSKASFYVTPTTSGLPRITDIVRARPHVSKVPMGVGFPLAQKHEMGEAKAEAGRMTRDPCNHLFRRRWRQTGLNVGTGLNSTNHCRKILFEGYEVFPAK
jgi:hypothetical protein